MIFLFPILLWGLALGPLGVPAARADNAASVRISRPRPRPAKRFRWLPYYWNAVPTLHRKKGDGNGDGSDGSGDYDSSIGGGGDSGSAGSGGGLGSGLLGAGGNGSGGKGGAPGSFGYDKNAQKSTDGRDVERPGNQPPGGPPPGGQPPAPPTRPTPLPKWWPMCVFIDPAVPNGNDIIKGMVQFSAACGVALEVYAITLNPGSYPPDEPNTINSLQKQSCNLQASGIPKGSTQVIGTSETAADKMCESYESTPGGGRVPTRNVAGCAELAQGGMTDDQRKKGNAGGEQMQFSSGNVAASIVDPSGWSAGVASHEGIGHSEMGWPNGQNAGMGIGSPDEVHKGGGIEGQGSFSGYTGLGCGQMSAMALPNDGTHIYDPNQKEYYYRAMNPKDQWILGHPMFTPPPKAPPAPPQSPPGGGTPPGSPPSVAQEPPASPPPGASSSSYANKGTPTSPSAGPDARHPGPGAGVELASVEVVTIRSGDGARQTGAGGVISTARAPGRPVIGADGKPGGGKASASGYAYNNGATKSAGDSAGGGGGGRGTTSRAPASTAAGDASGFGYNNGASKSAGDGSSGSAGDVGAGGDGLGNPGGAAGAVTGGAAGRSGTQSVSIFDDVKAGSGILDDDFFTKLQFEDEETTKRKKRKRIGGTLRKPGNTVREIPTGYKATSPEQVIVPEAEPGE